MTPADLLIPLAVAVIVAGLGYLGHRQHPGRRCKPLHRSVARTIWRRVTRRRTARVFDAVLEAAAAPVHGPETIAQAAATERAFAPPARRAPLPLLARQQQLGVLAARLQSVPSWAEPATGPIHPPMWAAVPPQDGPVPTALADVRDDPDYPHLASGQFGDWVTGQFAAVIEGEK